MEIVNTVLADENEIALDSVLYMVEYCDRLAKGLPDIATQLQTGMESKAFATLLDVIDGMSLMLQLIQSCISMSNSEPEKIEQSIKTYNLLGVQLEAMIAAMERQDYGTLADQLEYELVEIIETQVKPLFEYYVRILSNKLAV